MIRLGSGISGLKSAFKGLLGNVLRRVPGRRRGPEAWRDNFSNACLTRPMRSYGPSLVVPKALLQPKKPGQRLQHAATRAAQVQKTDLGRTQLACQKLLKGMLALHAAMLTQDTALQAELFLKLFGLQAQANNFLRLAQRVRRYEARTPYQLSAAAAHNDQLLAFHCEAAEELLGLYNASLDFVATAPAAFLTQQILLQQAVGSLLSCVKQQGSTTEIMALTNKCKPLLTALPLPSNNRRPTLAEPADDAAVFAAYEQEADASSAALATLSQDVEARFVDQQAYHAERKAAEQQLTQATEDALAVNNAIRAQLSFAASPPQITPKERAQLEDFLAGVRGNAFGSIIEMAVLRDLCGDFEPDIYTESITAAADNEKKIDPSVVSFFNNEVRNKYYPLYKRGEYNDASEPRIALLNTRSNSHFELLVVEDTRHYPEQPQYKEAAAGIKFEPKGQGANNCLYLAYIVGSKLQNKELALREAQTRSFKQEAAELRQTVADELEDKVYKDADFRASVLSCFVTQKAP